MAQPYIGEIRIFAGNFAPLGWAFCDGQLLPISENETLFVLIGTIYGGDGQETFALPNLQSRVPIHRGTGPGLPTYTIGETGGVESVTLTVNQMPVHTHTPVADAGNGTTTNPQNNLWAGQPAFLQYASAAPNVNMKIDAIQPVGGSQPHNNLQPYLTVSFILSLFGIFPNQ
jgi:microcystin-dependent protein